jgi:hypothetical protein
MLASEKPLKKPARSKLKEAVDRMELLQAEPSIATREWKGLKATLGKRARQGAGKREIIKDKLLLSVLEVRDRILAKEAESAAKKASGGRRK